ncbi:ABC transporter ATP-binding protein [Modestobacter sp. VKM Ac-2978]|uniref:ABC transporter ATP-binding protein n=1 Tax=Modestobacter sp. VKM Ac-2978 TaxID=3004132 RepID=UPI0022AB4C8E|nr:ABC transporter ATP-binding protein [Modestobacter sp. VKM Ac-2978]MCZ2849115.1 ABC transporter ATP-binding protein [Modestobacter sp. VKM Ac-2978]
MTTSSTTGGAPTGADAPLLTARGVQRKFGGLVAVDVEEFHVRRGTITALIGPNGAGKSTFFNLLTGFDRADAGSWQLDGRTVTGLPAYRLAQQGMVRTFQLTRSLADLTLEENVLLAARGQRGERLAGALFGRASWRRQEADNTERARELLARFGLERMAAEPAGVLSGGQRKLLEMARALMCEPRLLLLDEPMAGVNPRLVETLLDHIRQVRADGTTILFVEHDMDVVAGISDDVVCMAFGTVLATGSPEQVMRDPEVIDAYLGSDEPDDDAATAAGTERRA